MDADLLEPNRGVWTSDSDPNWEVLGYLEAVCHLLQGPPLWQDSAGYQMEIVAAAVEPSQHLVAWVLCRQKMVNRSGRAWLDIEYRLKAQEDGQEIIDWEVSTYNPFFGCRVGYIAWHGDRVIMIYREKHDTYISSLGRDNNLLFNVLADSWRVVGDIVQFRRWNSVVVEQRDLPWLAERPSLTGAEALATGLL